MSGGCSPSGSTPVEPNRPDVQTPATTDQSSRNFSVISHATTTNEYGTERQVWCIYVKAFKDAPSVWDEIRSYGLNLADQLNAGNGQNAVALYFFDVLNGVSSPAVVDNFWNVPGEDPHCVASISVDTSGQVVAWKYPFVDSKASPL
jgi:hypothetical protein